MSTQELASFANPNFNEAEAIVGKYISDHIAAGKSPDEFSSANLDSQVIHIATKRGVSADVLSEAAKLVVRKFIIQKKISDSWSKQGGPRSHLGLPKDVNFKVMEDAGNYYVAFRGGKIFADKNLSLRTELLPPARVTFEGLILHERSERSKDEIYGQGGFWTASTLINGSPLKGEFLIEQVSLGGKGNINTRVWKTSREIYRGAPAQIEMIVGLSEHDSGDKQKVRNQVKTVINEAAGKVAGLFTGGMGANPAAIAQAAEQASRDNLGKLIVDAAANLIVEIFGLDDDPYNPGGLTILAEEMESPPPLKIARHKVDNKVIEYTHKIDMHAVGDGACSAYFRVWR